MEPKVVVITGASGGIGAALARELGIGGHTLVLAARRELQLRAAASASEARRVLAVVSDVTKRSDVERIAAEAIREFGHIDVWVNNAGRGIARPVLDLTDEDVDAMITINLKSVLYGAQAVIPHFKERGEGHLINVSSFLGRVPVASVRSVYSASKAAMSSLTTNLRWDLQATHPKIHVTLVMPGVVATEFARNVLHPPKGAPPPQSPTFKPQTAEQVARVIADVIEAPGDKPAEVYTNPQHPEVVKRFYADPGSFEA